MAKAATSAGAAGLLILIKTESDRDSLRNIKEKDVEATCGSNLLRTYNTLRATLETFKTRREMAKVQVIGTKMAEFSEANGGTARSREAL